MNFCKLLILLAFVTACVSPRDKSSQYDDPFASESNASDASSDGTSTAIDTTDGSSTSSASSSVVVPDEIDHCDDWSSDGSTGFETTSNSHLGPHTICQSSTTETDVYVQVANSSSSVRVCVIPLYEDSSSGKSIFLGEARCSILDSNQKIYKFPLLKNRDYGKYQNFSVNAVMVMKEESHFYESPFYMDQITYDAFFVCSVYLDLYGDQSYCESFSSKGEYVFKRF